MQTLHHYHYGGSGINEKYLLKTVGYIFYLSVWQALSNSQVFGGKHDDNNPSGQEIAILSIHSHSGFDPYGGDRPTGIRQYASFTSGYREHPAWRRGH